MGLMFSLVCPGCSYQIGQLLAYWGMDTRYEIKRCNHDQELVSVLVEVAVNASPERQDALKDRLLRCPHCNGRDLSGVQEPYACPKCKTMLIEGADGGRWD